MDARQHCRNGLIKTRWQFDDSVDSALRYDEVHVEELFPEMLDGRVCRSRRY